MRTFFANDDLKRLANGIAVACASGVLLGAAFQPDLDEHDASGPQMVMGESGARKVFAAADPGIAMYEGQLPDYVVGTYWKRAQQPPQYTPVADEAPETVVYSDEAPAEPVEVARAAWVEPPRGPVVYPSMNGSTDYEANLPPAPEPPGEFEAVDAG